MSRSHWALAETRRCGRLVHSAGERRRLDGQSCLERRLLPSAVSATKYTVILLAAGILVMAAEPAQALASSTRGGDPAHSPAPPVRPASLVVLGFGSGYGDGSTTVAVRALQHRLDSIGYAPGPIDGRYGPRTEHAVELFQSAHGLQVDGIAGPITRAALRTPSTMFYPGAGYSGRGSDGVRGLQRRLRRDGYSPGPIDGRYGPLTTGAVRRFQAAHDLHVDGIAGARTFRDLRGLAPQRRPGTHAPPPRPTTAPPSNHRRPIHPKRSQPSARPATRPNGSSWPVVLALAGLIGVAMLVGGVWLVTRRRRGITDVARRPSGTETPTAAVVAAEAESDLMEPQAESSVSAGIEPSSETEYAVELGFLLLEQGEVAGAERAYRYADERGDAVAASNLGVLLEHRGDVRGAEAAYRRADARGSADGAVNLAQLLFERGEAEEAMAAFHRADRRGDAGAALGLGRMLMRQGDRVAAHDAYGRADERGDPRAAAELGALLEEMGDFPGAASAYSRAAERGHAGGAFRLGVLLERRNDSQGALRAYERAQTGKQPEIAEMARERALALSRGAEQKR